MSDQAETVLFRMARGTGLHGLTGIPPRRGCYVRPCLCLTRADTEAYCAALGQHYIQDETNAKDTYARNRIRHDAIPALQYANSAAERSIAIDPRSVPLGSPVFLVTTRPNSSAPLNRLVMAQDTGGAIKGAVRADFFWGFGKEAGELAGRMKQSGRMWVLLPAELAPK